MATNTYVALATANGTGSSAVISFTDIPSTYTDLVIRGGYSSTSGAGFDVTLNNVTTNTSYSTTRITFSGGSAVSYRQSNQNQFSLNYNGSFATTPDTSVIEIDFFDYANTTTYKTMLAKYGNTTTDSGPVVGHWRGSTGSATEAINRIDLKAAGGGNWTTGTTFSLYGIRREGVSPAPKATGGVISSDSTYYYHTFPATGVFTPSQSLTCDYFVVAGGGGAGATVGGGWAGGGGGAGGYRTFTGVSFASGTAYTATVGAGGTGGSGSGGFGNKGSNTTLIGGAISTATTGGGGGGTSKENGNTQTDGRAGGSGGGAPQNTIAANGGAGNEGGYTPVEGYAGYSYVSGDLGAGQGGGAGGVGTRAIYLQEIPFNGVTAFDSNRYSSGGAARWLTADNMNALPNTGNGGFSKNDGTGTNYTGGTGGSGIVVIRYLKA